MDLGLAGKTVIVTGAARGIGLACASAFLGEGARVVMADYEGEAGASAAESLAGEGRQVRFVRADMREEVDIARLVAETEQSFGPIDICVNNAAVTHRADLLEMRVEDFDRVLATNLRGPFLLGQAVARRMVAQGRAGAITNLVSVNAVVALPDNAAYVSSKGGLLQLTKSMALALAPRGIRVNAVGPGSIDTPLQRAGMSRSPRSRRMVLSRTPLGRLGRPEEVADAVLFISSSRASYITGQCLYVDGGRLPLNLTVPVTDTEDQSLAPAAPSDPQ